MNTKLYRPPEGWPPSPGDTIVLRKRPSPGQPPPPGRGAMVLKVLREEDKSAMLEPNPECPRCKECLTFEQELTSWVCHRCGKRAEHRGSAQDCGQRLGSLYRFSFAAEVAHVLEGMMRCEVPSLTSLAARWRGHFTTGAEWRMEVGCQAGVRLIGVSERGHPLLGAVIGTGSRHATLIGGAHADEPVGPETLRPARGRRHPARAGPGGGAAAVAPVGGSARESRRRAGQPRVDRALAVGRRLSGPRAARATGTGRRVRIPGDAAGELGR